MAMHCSRHPSDITNESPLILRQRQSAMVEVRVTIRARLNKNERCRGGEGEGVTMRTRGKESRVPCSRRGEYAEWHLVDMLVQWALSLQYTWMAVLARRIACGVTHIHGRRPGSVFRLTRASEDAHERPSQERYVRVSRRHRGPCVLGGKYFVCAHGLLIIIPYGHCLGDDMHTHTSYERDVTGVRTSEQSRGGLAIMSPRIPRAWKELDVGTFVEVENRVQGYP